MEKSLLQQAKERGFTRARRSKNKFDEEQLQDLALAWLRDEVGFAQASAALKTEGSGTYTLLAVALKHAFLQGKFKLP